MHVSVEPENWYGGTYNYNGLKAKDWIVIEPSEFDIKPGGIKKVTVKIKVPKGRAGELVAQIFFASVMPGSETSAGAGVRSRLGATLYVAIKDTEKVLAKIKSIDISESDSKGAREVLLSVTVLNEGNVHLLPESGTIFIKPEKDGGVIELPLVTKQDILPEKEFSYTATWNNPVLRVGTYNVVAKIKYGRMFGREKGVELESAFEVDKTGKVITK